MSKLTIVGLDPSMSNFGMVKGVLDLNSRTFCPTDIKLIETKSDKTNKKTVRKNSDDLNRAKLLYNGMSDFIIDADLISVEIPVGSQTARAMTSYGVCIGVLSSIKQPMIQVTPAEVKLATCNKKTATKEEMINWATSLYPNLNWITRKYKGQIQLTKKNEHIADALATVHAACKTDQFLQMLSIYKLK